MTAARVLNPVVLTEFYKIGANPAASIMMGRNLNCGGHQQLNRIKRDLFGPVNPVETNKIFVEELDKHQEKAIKKWGFDFRTGTPLNANSPYVWERVTFPEAAYTPEMYTLTRVAHLRPNTLSQLTKNASAYDLLLDERAERENCTSMSSSSLSSTDTDDSCDDTQDDNTDHSSSEIFKIPATVLDATGKILRSRKRQPKITEYMKERKRLAQTPKKLTSAKRMRTSPPDSNFSNSYVQQHISNNVKFSIRKVQRNN